MRYRWATLAVAAVMAAVIRSALPVPVAGQAPGSSATPWSPPRTAWGHPDLQGVWNYNSNTPLERAAEFGNRLFLTDEEFAQREKATAERQVKLDNRPPAALSPEGPGGAGGNYNRFWGEYPRTLRQTSLIIDPQDGRLPSYTPEAEKWYADVKQRRQGIELDAPTPGGFVEDLGPRGHYTRCILGFNEGPPMTALTAAQNPNVQIFQSPDHVVLLNEMIHSARVVPLDGRAHLPSGIRQWLGDSRGGWEGNTLLVTTTNFTDIVTDIGGPLARATATRPFGMGMTLVERFTRTAADELLYQFTIHDPRWYTAPWTAQAPMARSQERLFEYACHEGNYSLPTILAGARDREKAAGQDAAGRR